MKKYLKYFSLLLVVALFITGCGKAKEKEEVLEKNIDQQNLEMYPYLMVVTAKYGATKESKEFIDRIFGDNAEEKFRTYFQWYNVVHELTHGLITYNNNTSYLEHNNVYAKEGYKEEQRVNDFAVAYWKRYGDPEKFELFKNTVYYVLSKMKDPTDGKLTIEEYGKQLWESDNPDASFEEYGWFQFNSVRLAIEKDLSLEEAYANLKLDKEAKFDDIILNYGIINEESCERVIDDTINKFQKWGLVYPEVYHIYDDDPNQNYSKSITKIQYEQLKNN